MAVQKAEGIILRKYQLRETSYILSVFTKEFGKIKGVIKGVRKPCMQSTGNYEIFNRSDLLFYKKKKSMDLITQCEAIECFISVRKNIERLTYANYFIELVEMVSNEMEPDLGFYNLLYKSLRMLESGFSPKRVSRIFELKLLGFIGLSPNLDRCSSCNSVLENNIRFDNHKGGIMCQKCSNIKSSKVSKGTLNFMRKIQKSDLLMTERIKVSKEVGVETENILKGFLQYQLNRPIKTFKFIEQLQKRGIV